MIENRYIISQTNAFFDKKNTENVFLSLAEEERLEENPEYSASKYRLRELKISLQHELFEGADTTSTEKKIAETEAKFQKIRASLLSAVDKAPSLCSLCGDSGYYKGALCDCYYKKLNENAYSFLGIREKSLHGFKDDIPSFSAANANAYGAIKKFVEKIAETDRNVLIIGQKGTGKTFLSECAASSVNQGKHNAVFISSFDLNNVFVKNITLPFEEKLITSEILTTCDLLVIDDLGTEPVYNKVTIENLTSIISERLENKKPFLINTNLELGEISMRYGERLFSRLCGRKTVIIKMDGKDLRFN